jgi:hypothetical protein
MVLTPEWNWSPNPNVNDEMMDSFALAVASAQSRGLKPDEILSTINFAVGHFSSGRRHVTLKETTS